MTGQEDPLIAFDLPSIVDDEGDRPLLKLQNVIAWVEILEDQLVIYKDRLSLINVGTQKLTIEVFDLYSLRFGLVNRYDMNVKISFKPYIKPVIVEDTNED